jgi:hypothetical protein
MNETITVTKDGKFIETSELKRDYAEIIKSEPCLENRVLERSTTRVDIFKRKDELKVCLDCPYRQAGDQNFIAS